MAVACQGTYWFNSSTSSIQTHRVAQIIQLKVKVNYSPTNHDVRSPIVRVGLRHGCMILVRAVGQGCSGCTLQKASSNLSRVLLLGIKLASAGGCKVPISVYFSKSILRGLEPRAIISRLGVYIHGLSQSREAP